MGLSSRTIRPGSTKTAAFIFSGMMLPLAHGRSIMLALISIDDTDLDQFNTTMQA
jgi:hypothetical protein